MWKFFYAKIEYFWNVPRDSPFQISKYATSDNYRKQPKTTENPNPNRNRRFGQFPVSFRLGFLVFSVIIYHYYSLLADCL